MILDNRCGKYNVIKITQRTKLIELLRCEN